jgi:hypothetical protein
LDVIRNFQLGQGQPYGPLAENFRYDLRAGYTALVGPNNAGKSSLLQLIFRSLYVDPEFGSASLCFIPADRDYVDPTTQTGGRALNNWNDEMYSQLIAAPIQMASGPIGPNRSELTRLLLHGDFLPQMDKLNDLLPRFGLPPVTLAGAQEVQFVQIVVHAQGSGLRSLLPILAAITNDDIEAVFIDEPELGLEPRLQKALRDLLVETATTKRVIATATHSHLLIDRQETESTQIVTRDDAGTSVETVTTLERLYSLTFDLLGSSTEDLFFPRNYLIVEGASDQVIVERVLELLGQPASAIKVLSAQGVDEVRAREISVVRALVPLIVNDSPYAGRVVAMIDMPGEPEAGNVQRLRQDLGDRLYVLDEPTIEAYVPAEIYERAGRSKEADLAALQASLQNPGARRVLKKSISDALAATLTADDLDAIPVIAEAARRAAEL